jgi:hypothetical protein
VAKRDDDNRAVRNAKKFAGDTINEFKAKPLLIVACIVVVLIVLRFIF